MADQPQKEQLLALRDRIDALDADIGKLISERARCAQQVADVKNASGDGEVLYYRPEREAQVLRKAMERNQGPLSDEEMAKRKAAWQPPAPKVDKGYLVRYARMVTSANSGAVLK